MAVGQPGRGEQAPHPLRHGRVGGPRALPCTSGSQDLAGLRADGDQRGEIVQRLAGRAHEEVADHPEQGPHRQPHQQERQVARRRVGEQRVERGAALLVVRVPPGQRRPADAAMSRLGVEHHGRGRHQGGVSGGRNPPAEVDIVAKDRQLLVEAAELLEQAAADEHAGGVDGEDRSDLVVLPLVVLPALESDLAGAGARDRDADLEQSSQRGPLAQLRPDDLRLRVVRGRREQGGERTGVGVGVVVEQPDPLGRVRQRRQPGEPQLHRSRERGRDRCVHRLTESCRQQVGALVAAPRVHGHDPGQRRCLGPDPLDHRRQPAGAVVADQQRGDGLRRRRRHWGRDGLGHDPQP